MPNFKKGTAALQEHQEKAAARGEGNFRQFAPFMSWNDDGDEKHLLFLNRWEDMPQVDYIGFIPMKGTKGNGDTFTYYEAVIARTDPAIVEETGETVDPLTRDLDAKPKRSHIAVAVELEPEFEEVEIRGRMRKRPSGFSVKTESFNRRVRNDKGDLTEETEEVTQPVIGFVVQSPANFFNMVASFDSSDGPIHEVPVTVTRVGGKGSNSTTYRVDGHDEAELDLSGLLDYLDGISYLGDDVGDLEAAIEDAEDDLAAANIVGDWLLDKRIEELCDKERYEEIAKETIATTLDKFGGGKGKGNKTKDSEDKPKTERPKRQRQRRKSEDAAEAVSEAPAEETPPSDPVAEAPAEKPVAEPVADATDDSDSKAKLKRLREQAAKRRAGAKASA
jgi:hypothetical protein